MKGPLLVLLIVLGSLSALAQARTDLITDFRQGQVVVDDAFQKCTSDYSVGNCVAIAVIKTSLAQAGSIDRVFRAFRRDGDSIRCTFHDGTVVAIGPAERDTVRRRADLEVPRGQTSVFVEDAITMYALICKRMLRLQSDLVSDGEDYKKCVKSFPSAVQYLCSGYPTGSGNLLIAWNRQRITDFSTLDTVQLAIVRSSKHAAFITLGQQDRFGRIHRITRIMRRGRPTDQWNMQGANSSTQRIKAAYTLIRPQ